MVKKLKLIIITLVSVIIFTACSNGKTSEKKVSFVDNADNYLKISADNNGILKLTDYNELKEDYKLEYPENINFVPTYLYNGKLFGEGTRVDNSAYKFLVSYDLTNEKVDYLFTINDELHTDDSSTILSYINDKYIVFQKYNLTTKILTTNLYNIETKENKEIHSINEVNTFYHSSAVIENDTLLFNVFNKEKDKYNIFTYDLKTGNKDVLEEEFSASPVFFKNKIYYLLIDNDKAETRLVEYDNDKKVKAIIYKTNEKNNYLTGIYTNGEELLLTNNREKAVDVYSVNLESKYIILLFSKPWIESLDFKKEFVTFLGDIRSENRSRLQNYLVNTHKKIDYDYNHGSVFVSDKGIAWIEYKKEEQSIPKGSVFTNENSLIKYKKFE